MALANKKQSKPEDVIKASEKTARDLANRLTRLIRDESLLARDFDQFGLNALRPLLDEMKGKAADWATEAKLPENGEETTASGIDAAMDELREIAREFAKLDGYNVWRRSIETAKQPGKRLIGDDGKEEYAPARQSWIIPIRVWAQLDSWGVNPDTEEESEKPTHDADGLVRLDYLDWLRDTLKVFDTDGTVKKAHLDRLDPECLEALDFNLSAGRHKPFTFDAGEHRPPAELIGELDAIHAEIRQRLGRLLKLVESEA